jgi:hypothetical protein
MAKFAEYHHRAAWSDAAQEEGVGRGEGSRGSGTSRGCLEKRERSSAEGRSVPSAWFLWRCDGY